ncbi:MAG: hypothetical protein GY757_19810 [bacterium]|nr:hypothetical protein [bacterium]
MKSMSLIESFLTGWMLQLSLKSKNISTKIRLSYSKKKKKDGGIGLEVIFPASSGAKEKNRNEKNRNEKN